MMIEDFSAGYYRTTMNVQEYRRGPAIQRDLHDFIKGELYVDSTVPVTMRVGLDASDSTFSVKPENSIPYNVLGLPQELVEDAGEKSVFVVKSESFDTVGEYNG